MADFTPTQGRYLSYIHAYTVGFGLPPADSEIAEAIGVSPPSVNQMMNTLQKKGLIHREPGVPRSIQILIDESLIPKWSGGKITRVVREWVMTNSDTKKQARPILANKKHKPPAEIYVIKITLSGSKPPIWRRIETGDVSLAKLHELIQAAMGWTNSHLHQFVIGEAHYVDPRGLEHGMMDWAQSYSGITIAKLVAIHGAKLKMQYDYDFGDGWTHNIVLEKIVAPKRNVTYPCCTAGKNACPPEDVGGIWGYYEYLEAISNPKHPEHEEYMEWSGPFDATEFDYAETTHLMQTGMSSW
ncbi:IS1096 element passenger TnpR family protein [Rhodopirellula baltica]